MIDDRAHQRSDVKDADLLTLRGYARLRRIADRIDVRVCARGSGSIDAADLRESTLRDPPEPSSAEIV